MRPDCWRRDGRGITRIGLVGLGLGLAACAADDSRPYPGLGQDTSPHVGLFTPGSKLGVVTGGAAPITDPDAGTDDPYADVMDQLDVSGDRCAPYPGEPGTDCELTVEFGTVPLGQPWGPDNVGAVWVEDAAEEPRHVRTLYAWGPGYVEWLLRWDSRSCRDGTEVDAISAATRQNHDMGHSATWDCRDLHDNLVPDGTYVLHIEVTETETDVGAYASYAFEKGPEPQVLTPADSPEGATRVPDLLPHENLKITYTPKP